MKKFIMGILLLIPNVFWAQIPVNNIFKKAKEQYTQMLQVATNPSKPPRTTKDGKLVTVPDIYDWTSGFFAGNLWYTYEATKDSNLKKAAINFTEALKPLKDFTGHHDLGFMMYCSYGNAYRLTKNEQYKDILIQTANSLSTRFSEKTGCIKSWNKRLSWDGKTTWYFPVIIDNMMNLELLFFASTITGNNKYRDIAIKHAETTLKNHLRPDYSSYHVINYDTATGVALNKETCQGYADNSTWARGQAWGIYGFTVVYRETGDKKFLDAAINMANFYLNNKNIPADNIPIWDLNVNEPGYTPLWKYDPNSFKTIPRDASAAAIIASALLELQGYTTQYAKIFNIAANNILNSLSSVRYLSEVGQNGNFLLKHSVGSIPHNSEIDVPLVYADYYYLEALSRLKNNSSKLNKYNISTAK